MLCNGNNYIVTVRIMEKMKLKCKIRNCIKQKQKLHTTISWL
jgi:hypothetical protein